MPRQNRISLETVQVEPVQFNPTQVSFATFTPQIPNYQLLQHSFDQREQRRKEAVEKVSALDNAFTQARSQLHNDEATMQWYRDYTDKARTRLKELIDFGDYGNAIDIGTKVAGEFMEDKQYAARFKRNQEYTDWEKAVDSSTVNQAKKDYYKDVYKYEDKDLFDENGNVVEGRKWNAPIPKGDLHWDTIYRQSAADVAEAMSANQRGGGFTGDYTANQWQSGYETHAKELDRIVANVKQYFNNNQGEWDKFEEDYKVLRWQYNNLIKARAEATPGTEEYNDADDAVRSFIAAHTFAEKGFPSREDLILQKISEQNPYIKNFAYTRTSKNSDNRSTNKPASKRMGDLQTEAMERDLYEVGDEAEPVNGDPVAQDSGSPDMDTDYMYRKFVGRPQSKVKQTMSKQAKTIKTK